MDVETRNTERLSTLTDQKAPAAILTRYIYIEVSMKLCMGRSIYRTASEVTFAAPL
jgi:hypothetical protein